ncbi:MAG: protein translocase subunit SecF [Dehalococcoidia bacterium]|nr:protein translocase subunit SecF [Dehalococcoidia bacterium]
MDFVAKRYWFYLLSILVILPGIISLLIPPSLFLGIEFTGGSTVSVGFAAPVENAKVRELFAGLGHPEAVVQATGDNGYFIRTSILAEAQAGGKAEREIVRAALDGLATVTRMDVASVSGVVAKDTVRNATIAVLVASVAILLYITWAFRAVPNPIRYGVAAVIALLHDVLVVVGIFSILGKTIHLEIDAMFITGLLTIIGYSVNDTIVVFDRIRENVTRLPGERLERVVNISILESLGRSLNTSMTSLTAVAALLLLGGDSTRNFVLVLLVGITSGAYSSICNASQILVSWETGDFGRLRRRFRRAPVSSEA